MSGPTLAEVEALVTGARRAEARVAFLLTGDMLATLEELRALPAPFAAVLKHPLAADAFRFAFSARATKLRRELGSLWS